MENGNAKNDEGGIPTEASDLEETLRDREPAWPDTSEELAEEIEYLCSEVDHDYGTVPYALTLSALAAFHYAATVLGPTGMQGSWAELNFISKSRRIKTGLRLINYDHLLYPQYERSFEKTVSRDTWEAIVEAARENLAEYEDNGALANERVVEHWESIVEGNVPFGFKIED